ncbi:site-specific integrase [Thiomonas sp.]|uniref:tyrosine-type recombinase/integrase n=1 Tax=Thiomonas sp. TaxID=2047785 RepID=UPI00260AACFC|nr:site-specific integrase [Thiomonas sp.]
MAHFEQRTNGWRVQIRRRGLPSISRTFALKADAQAWATAIERELQRGNVSVLDTTAQRTTLGEVIERFQVSILGTYKASSRAPLESRLRQIAARWGRVYVAQIRPVDLAKWRDDLLAEKLSAQSVTHSLNLMSRLLRFAEQELGMALPTGNPARVVRKPSGSKARDRRLRPGELDALLRAADAARAVGVRELITLAVETSMRLGELLQLRWEHIDIQARTAHLVDTKNGQSRTVALSSRALAALDSLPRRIDGKVFAWKPGHENGSFENLWQRTLARARRLYDTDCKVRGIEPDPAFLADLRFHDLRHEATSRLFEKGLGIMEVASMTGHKSLSMLKRYTHIEAQKLAAKLG